MMHRIARRFGLTAFAASAVALSRPAAAEEADKAVYHLNQPGGANHAFYRQFLTNLRNHVEVVGEGRHELRVVMHGPGVDLLRGAARNDAEVAAAIDNLKLAGVRFEICRITLQRNNFRLDELYDAVEADLVPSGVVQVCRLQRQGFSYIKI